MTLPLGYGLPAPMGGGATTSPGAPEEPPDIALYVHWPFCRVKCPYCDFNSHVASEVDDARWAAALVRELDHLADATGRRRLTSIFFGGGTPSLMAPATVERVIGRASERFVPAPDLEITLEANPTSVEAGRLAAFRAAGVNRVSLGVQALDDAALRFLGREHGAREALAAVGIAARLFPRFSFDLIYARPGQTVPAWREELDRALDHAGGHLSVYQLTIEEGTRFHVLAAKGDLALPPDDVQADLFELTRDHLAATGLPAYEISNHAAPGEACRHNLAYWRYGDYAGVGPGAHGRLTLGRRRWATETARMPRAWLERVEHHGHAGRPLVEIERGEQVLEALLMGLRLVEGVEVRHLEAIAGQSMAGLFDRGALMRLQADGLLADAAGFLRATPAGHARLDGLLIALSEALR
jgi:putative oxygen-independent coproporphyrinogen III oxidase